MSDLTDRPDPYADCRNAVAWFESSNRRSTRLLVLCRMLTIEDVLEQFDHAANVLRSHPDVDSEDARLIVEAMSEARLPSFRTYLLARVWGAM